MGTRAPSRSKRLGSWRKSTTSWSSSFASSRPATSAQVTDDAEPGVISVGLTFGIIFTVRQSSMTTTHIRHEEHDREPGERQSCADEASLPANPFSAVIGTQEAVARKARRGSAGSGVFELEARRRAASATSSCSGVGSAVARRCWSS